MKSGVIGKIDGKMSNIESFGRKREEGKLELQSQIEFRNNIPGPRNNEAYSGRAAIERVQNSEEVQFVDEEIIISETKEKIQLYTDFLLVPDSFMIVKSGKGEFAFNLIEEINDVTIKRAEIDLFKVLESLSNFHPDPWQVRFSRTEGNAKKGIVYGEEVLSDSKFGDVLKSSTKKQIGLQYTNSDGTSIKFTASSSGYVQIYQPNNYDEIDFLNFVNKNIIPNIVD